MISQRKAGVLLSYLSAGLSTLTSLLYTPLMLRLLGQSEYGVYQTALAFVSYLSLLQFGLNNAFARFYTRYQTKGDKEGIRRLNGLYLTFYFVIAGIALLAGAVLVKNADFFLGEKLTPAEIDKARILMRILVVNTAATFPFTLFSSNITVNERYIFARLMTILKQVASPLAAIPLLLMGYNSVGIVVATTCITFIIGISEILYCVSRLHIGFAFGRMEGALVKEILVFTSFIFISTMVTQINWSLDRIVLARISGSVAVAIYSVAEQLNQYYLAMSTTVSDVFAPQVFRMANSGSSDREFTLLFTKVGRIQFMIMMMILSGFVVLGRSFIGKWAGAEYLETDAYLCAVLLFVGNLVYGMQYLGVTIQQSKNMHKFRSLLYIMICIVNVALSIPLAMWLGPLGAVIGTFFVAVVGNGLVMDLYYHRKIGIDMKFFWKSILSASKGLVIPAVAAALIMRFCTTETWGQMLLFGAVYVVIYGASMWLFAMNDYERDLILGPAERLWKRLRR